MKKLKINKIYNVDVLKLINKIEDNSIDLIITDPPYGINYYTNRRKKNTRGTEKGIKNDKNNINFIEKVLKELYRVLKPGRHIYWFGRYDSIVKHIPLFEKIGFNIKNNLIWIKNNHGTGDLYYSYAPKYECILYAIKPGIEKFKLQEVNGIRRHPDVLFFDKIPSSLLVHDHEKPTELIEFLIQKSSKKNEIILDPFVGSGQTALSAIFQNRSFISFEIDKNIWKVANNRISKYLSRNIKIIKSFSDVLNTDLIIEKNILKDIDGYLIFNDKKIKVITQKIDNNKLNINILSVFYFSKKNKNKVLTFKKLEKLIKNNEIKVSKYGKIYSIDNGILLLYIEKNNLNKNLEGNLNKYVKYQDEKYIYFPILINEIKNYINKKRDILKLYIENKKENKNTWEKLFVKLDTNDIITLKQV